MAYQIFADATADLTDSFLVGLPPVEIIPMQVEICGREFTYGPGGDLSIADFYKMQRDGNFAKTTQINPTVYSQCFEPVLQQGKDILYFSFSSGMSSTYQSCQIAAQELMDKYPDRKIICVDTLGATLGEGLLIRQALKMQENGSTLEQVADWVTEHRMQVCYTVAVDTFDHLRHGGRVSGAAAVAGTMLNIKPMLRIDENGRLEPTEKPRGRKRAIANMVSRMEQGWTPELGKSAIIVHADCPEHAQEVKDAVAKRFPDAEIEIGDLGPVIGAHTGPGLLAVIYWGNNR